jgi:hypothetical protein
VSFSRGSGFGWSPWLGPLDEFPVSTLLVLEAVQVGVQYRLDGTEVPQVVPRVVSDDPSTVRELVAHAAGFLHRGGPP